MGFLIKHSSLLLKQGKIECFSKEGFLFNVTLIGFCMDRNTMNFLAGYGSGLLFGNNKFVSFISYHNCELSRLYMSFYINSHALTEMHGNLRCGPILHTAPRRRCTEDPIVTHVVSVLFCPLRGAASR